MKHEDTGEFELVVGDKQLLSGFFIGVILLAVVFALGYVLGRSSSKSAGVAAETTASPTNTSDARPQPSTPVPPSPEPAAAKAAGQGDDSDPADTVAEKPPQPTTVPARDPAAPAAAAAAPAEPSNASYWQVQAYSSRNAADAVYQTLKDKGFPVTTHPGPNNLTLVWVGPYTDKDSLTRAKKRLEEAGFQNIIIKHP